MSYEILHEVTDDGVDRACLMDTGSNWAFGPVFTGRWEFDAKEVVRCFVAWLSVDPRGRDDLESKYCDFCHNYLDEDDPATRRSLHCFIWGCGQLADLEYKAGLFARCDDCEKVFPVAEIDDNCTCEGCRKGGA